MKQKIRSKRKPLPPKTILRLPDLEVARPAVLNSLSCPDAQRGYRHAIHEFADWYCSEPRLSFSKTVVTRYRMHLESRGLAPGTINLRLGAVRRLAYEAADCGLLSADLAAGIRRVKGVKKLGLRLGNWLTAEQAQALWQAPDCGQVKGKRRSCTACFAACLRPSPPRTCQADFRPPPTTRRPLGYCGPAGEGWSRSHHSCSGLGARHIECLDNDRRNYHGESFSPGQQRWPDLGRSCDGKAGLARRQGVRQ